MTRRRQINGRGLIGGIGLANATSLIAVCPTGSYTTADFSHHDYHNVPQLTNKSASKGSRQPRWRGDLLEARSDNPFPRFVQLTVNMSVT